MTETKEVSSADMTGPPYPQNSAETPQPNEQQGPSHK
jgi:hypothetical protein